MEILAKPYGVTLKEHIENVLREGAFIIQSFPFSFDKYNAIIGKDLTKRLRGAIKYHDDGKKNELWQNACKKDYENYLAWKNNNEGDFKIF